MTSTPPPSQDIDIVWQKLNNNQTILITEKNDIQVIEASTLESYEAIQKILKDHFESLPVTMAKDGLVVRAIMYMGENGQYRFSKKEIGINTLATKIVIDSYIDMYRSSNIPEELIRSSISCIYGPVFLFIHNDNTD